MPQDVVDEGTETVEDPFAGAPLGRLVFERTYARPTPHGRKETWYETVQRVVDGNLSLVSPSFHEPTERERLLYLITNRIAIPAGRHLWASGTTSHALQNCFRAGWSTGYAGHAAFNFDQLMKGGGVGANYSSTYFAKMPRFQARIAVRFTCDPTHQDYEALQASNLLVGRNLDDPIGPEVKRTVDDSREGWVEALNTLIWHSINSVPVSIVYNVSQVRPEGAPIVGFGGTAAGPGPLMLMLLQVTDLLNKQRGKRPTPLFAMEVDHAIADCVVAGNVRRSARMSILHWKDPEIFDFIDCKADKTKHWSTNISVEVDTDFFAALSSNDPHANAVLDRTIQGMLRDGEPGFYNSELAAEGEISDVRATNPCGELALEEWESCILGHVNLAKGTERERMEAFRLMARFLVRTTCAPIQDPKQREVVQRNRRIGVGFFGLQEFMATEGWSYSHVDFDGFNYLPTELSNRMQSWKLTVRNAADEYADEMQIPRPIKVTTVAPTGTIAKLAGTTEGVQPIFARHFIRRVRYADSDTSRPLQYPSEPCIYSQNTTVVSIPCEDPVVGRLNGQSHLLVDASELTVDKALQLQALIQENYTDNSISHTINVPPDSVTPRELREALLVYLPRLKGTTVMVDASRPQSPYERITKQEYLQLVSAEEVHYSETDDSLLEGCASGACPIK